MFRLLDWLHPVTFPIAGRANRSMNQHFCMNSEMPIPPLPIWQGWVLKKVFISLTLQNQLKHEDLSATRSAAIVGANEHQELRVFYYDIIHTYNTIFHRTNIPSLCLVLTVRLPSPLTTSQAPPYVHSPPSTPQPWEVTKTTLARGSALRLQRRAGQWFGRKRIMCRGEAKQNDEMMTCHSKLNGTLVFR